MPLSAYERAARRIAREEREQALREALANKPDPLAEFNEQFAQTPFADVFRRHKKIATRPHTWPVLHRLLVHAERWLQPLEEWKPRGKAPETILRSLVDHLICRYPVPSFWYEVWFRHGRRYAPMETENGAYLDAPETREAVAWFVALAQGSGMHRLVRDHEFPVQLTKRQCHELMQQKDVNTLVHAVRWTQVRTLGGTRRLAEVLCTTPWGDRFGDEEDPVVEGGEERPTREQTEEFRSKAVQWFCGQPMLDPAQVSPLIDYMEHCREETEDWSLKGRTARSLMRDMEQWHADLAAGRAAARRARMAEWRAESVARRKPPPSRWDPSGFAPMSWTRERKDPRSGKRLQETWRVEELCSRDQLAEEGAALRHCVASYAWSAGHGRSSIWSVRREAPAAARVLTVEVHNSTKMVRQVRGLRNRLPTASERAVVERWAREAGLQIVKTAIQGW